MTPDEYLAKERAAGTKSEYHDGHVFAMAGGTARHSRIANNVGRVLSEALDERPCFVSNSDLRVGAKRKSYMYPDVSVACQETEVEDDLDDILLNPIVVVEVLSKSSEAYDRGFKFTRYRKIDSLAQYVLVSQDQPLVEVFTRQPGGDWLLSVHEGLEATVRLESLDCSIPLSGIYRKINFSESPLE
jgi:Uma2 family endonuclease